MVPSVTDCVIHTPSGSAIQGFVSFTLQPLGHAPAYLRDPELSNKLPLKVA